MFKLDERLVQDCWPVGQLDLCHLLLLDNAALPWFVLVPRCSVTEISDLDETVRSRLYAEIHDVSRFVQKAFDVHKLNVASIGNVVSQLHVHVVGRRTDDYCWPGVVWGTEAPARYLPDRVAVIQRSAMQQLELKSS